MKYVQNWRLSILVVATFNTLLFSSGAAVAAPNDSSLPNGENVLETICPDKAAEKLLDCYWDALWITETSAIVKIPTYKGVENLQAHLNRVKDFLRKRAEAFNQGQKTLKFRFFDWHASNSPHWLFGFRLGNGPRKVSLITHIDTVPPGGSDRPFEPRIEKRLYMVEEMPFLVGRGTIDDKGPAISTFIVLRALAKQFDDNPKALDGFTFELIFDTSEETSMATHRYLKANEKQKPDFGIVFDASWCIRAEKGIERPVFWLPRQHSPSQHTSLAVNQKSALESGFRNVLWIESLNTSNGPVNQIPNVATATIKAISSKVAAQFANQVKSLYKHFDFDDPYYRAAELNVSYANGSDRVLLTTKVKGAQHGSAPHENRRDGANPLVSLANFLAYLVNTQQLANNAIGRMAQFIQWGWGTKVLGENHPDLLSAYDDVFEVGTTYALTQFVTDTEQDEVRLKIDIRYAIGHYSQGWDGKTEGLLLGKKSRFRYVFDQLVKRFDNAYPGRRVKFNTTTKYAPDIRNPDSAAFQRVFAAFRQVTGRDCPRLATGGGTDAKGYPELLACGPMFGTDMGPPINYHGDNEGAPLPHLKLGAEILYYIMVNEVQQKRIKNEK